MSVGSLITAKEQALSYQPLLLAEFVLADGTQVNLCTHGLDTTNGGFQYNSTDYLPRILNQNIAAFQILSDQGIAQPPSVSLKLNDGDKYLTGIQNTHGFKGATLTIRFIFWNVGNNDFSSDSRTPFVGICSAPQSIDATTLTIPAVSLMNMTAAQLPTIRIQKTCPWNFPTTVAQRQDGADNEDSWFYECGYSPDATGGNACGNYQTGTTPYTACSYTKADCVLRGMYIKDSANRQTGRFGGEQWAPPDSYNSRGYISGKFEEGYNTTNEAKYNDFVPIVYGHAWVEPIIDGVTGDGNSTRFCAILCYGQIDDVLQVIVNDELVPAATTITGSPLTVTDALFRWNIVNRGSRNGAPLADALFDSQGDPYGSLAVIEICVPVQLTSSNVVPRVRVLVSGPQIRVYSNTTTYTKRGAPENSNPVWVLMDALIWAGWNYSQLDIQSFINAAAICDVAIPYVTIFGSSSTHARFKIGTVLRQRRSAKDVIEAICGNMNAILVPGLNGLLGLQIKQTLADQQPAPITGSNYNTAVSSITAAGTTANGYVAYLFNASNVTRTNGKPNLTISYRTNQDTPNTIAMTFQDEDNSYALDSLNLSDSEAIALANQSVTGKINVDGITTFDQGQRIFGRMFAESFRGNMRNIPYGDAGGTLQVELETTFKAIHLQIGQIVMLDWPIDGIPTQLMRVIRIQPATNFETCKVTLVWHTDQWYTDAWGQTGSPMYSNGGHRNLLRSPFPSWTEYVSGGDDPLRGNGLIPYMQIFSYPGNQPGGPYPSGSATLCRLLGAMPVNTFSQLIQQPYAPVQGTTAPTGGTLKGGLDYWVWVCGVDTNGAVSSVTNGTKVSVPAGTNTNTITVSGLQWDPATAAHYVFIGPSWLPVCTGGPTTGAPSSITITGFAATMGAIPTPDSEFDTLRLKIKRVPHPGVFYVEPTTIGTSTVQVAGAGWTTNQWAGRIVSFIGRQEQVGVDFPLVGASWTVASNTSDTLTLSARGSLGSVSAWTGEGSGFRSMMVMRAQATSATSNTIADTGFANTLAQDGNPQFVQGATNASPIVINIPGHGYTTGQSVDIGGILGNTAANGIFPITVIDANNFSLNGSTGSGAYTAGGQCQALTNGLVPNAEAGRVVRIIAGTGVGQTAVIASNTATALTIQGTWAQTPGTDSVFWVENGAWDVTQDHAGGNITQIQGMQSAVPIGGVIQTNALNLIMDVAGLEQEPCMLLPVPVDSAGNETPESACAFAALDFYLFNQTVFVGPDASGQIMFSVPGTLAIGSNQAPITTVSSNTQATAITATVKQAPVGANLVITLFQPGGGMAIVLTIPAGQTTVSASPNQLFYQGLINANTNIQLDISAVGTTSPGSDLTVSISI